MNAKALSALWKAVPVITELFWDVENAYMASEAQVPWAYYTYNFYCTIPSGDCEPGQACAFGACIT